MNAAAATGKWMPCGAGFVEGDVLRWLEAIWKPKKRKSDRAERVGGRIILAQVLACDRVWADLKVMHCETQAADGWAIDNLKPGEIIRRRREPMGREFAATERREWSDESARGLVASKHFKAENGADALPNAPQRAGLAGGAKGPRRKDGSRRGYLRRGRRNKQLKP